MLLRVNILKNSLAKFLKVDLNFQLHRIQNWRRYLWLLHYREAYKLLKVHVYCNLFGKVVRSDCPQRLFGFSLFVLKDLGRQSDTRNQKLWILYSLHDGLKQLGSQANVDFLHAKIWCSIYRMKLTFKCRQERTLLSKCWNHLIV